MSDPQIIRELAYRLWLERGCPDGSPETDWREAERRLANPESAPAGSAARKRASRLRAPAADALPNRPPKNVEVQLEQSGVAPPRRS